MWMMVQQDTQPPVNLTDVSESVESAQPSISSDDSTHEELSLSVGQTYGVLLGGVLLLGIVGVLIWFVVLGGRIRPTNVPPATREIPTQAVTTTVETPEDDPEVLPEPEDVLESPESLEDELPAESTSVEVEVDFGIDISEGGATTLTPDMTTPTVSRPRPRPRPAPTTEISPESEIVEDVKDVLPDNAEVTDLLSTTEDLIETPLIKEHVEQ